MWGSESSNGHEKRKDADEYDTDCTRCVNVSSMFCASSLCHIVLRLRVVPRRRGEKPTILSSGQQSKLQHQRAGFWFAMIPIDLFTSTSISTMRLAYHLQNANAQSTQRLEKYQRIIRWIHAQGLTGAASQEEIWKTRAIQLHFDLWHISCRHSPCLVPWVLKFWISTCSPRSAVAILRAPLGSCLQFTALQWEYLKSTWLRTVWFDVIWFDVILCIILYFLCLSIFRTCLCILSELHQRTAHVLIHTSKGSLETKPMLRAELQESSNELHILFSKFEDFQIPFLRITNGSLMCSLLMCTN